MNQNSRLNILADLVEPSIREAQGNILDPLQVPDGATAEVPGNALIVPGTFVNLYVSGTTGDGAVVNYEKTESVKDDTVFPMPFHVPVGPIVELTGRQAILGYEVQFVGDPKWYGSPVQVYEVRAPQNLPPPAMDAAPGDVLDPAQVSHSVIVSLPAGVVQAGEAVRLHFGEYETSEGYGDPLSFAVPARAIGRVLGSGVSVYYQLLREGVWQDSQILPLQVGGFEPQDGDLPAPLISQASSGRLDLGSFAGDAEVSVAGWPLAWEGQYVWLEAQGTAGGTGKLISLLSRHPLTGAETFYGVQVPLPRGELEALDDGSTLTVRMWVSFSDSGDRTDAVLFPERRYDVVHSRVTTIDFEDLPLQNHRSGTRVGEAWVAVYSLNQMAVFNITGPTPEFPEVPPYFTGRWYESWLSNEQSFLLDAPVQNIKLAARVPASFTDKRVRILVYRNNAMVDLFDFDSAVMRWQEFHSEAPFNRFAVLALDNRRTVSIDNIQLW